MKFQIKFYLTNSDKPRGYTVDIYNDLYYISWKAVNEQVRDVITNYYSDIEKKQKSNLAH